MGIVRVASRAAREATAPNVTRTSTFRLLGKTRPRGHSTSEYADSALRLRRLRCKPCGRQRCRQTDERPPVHEGRLRLRVERRHITRVLTVLEWPKKTRPKPGFEVRDDPRMPSHPYLPHTSTSVRREYALADLVMLMRMRSVANGVKLTVRMTRLFPVTVPSVTHEEPFQPCTVKSRVP